MVSEVSSATDNTKSRQPSRLTSGAMSSTSTNTAPEQRQTEERKSAARNASVPAANAYQRKSQAKKSASLRNGSDETLSKRVTMTSRASSAVSATDKEKTNKGKERKKSRGLFTAHELN